MKILAVLTVRNEGAFLLEWIAHHRAAGITDFLVFSNDCQDGTDDMLDQLAAMGQLTHVRNDPPYGKGGIQFSAYKQAEKHPLVQSADWLITLDIDEFVNVHVGNNTLPALINALPEASAITLTWRLFGNDGQVRFQDQPVTQTFTKAAPVIMHWPWRAAMFKTLYKNDGTYRKLGVHRPRQPNGNKVKAAKWFDGEGRQLDALFTTERIFSPYGRSNYALAQLNHYALGAMESYVLKADRGRAVHSDDLLGLDYWSERNFCIDTDRSVLSLSDQTQTTLAQLKSEPKLARLHQSSVDWRHNRFTQLLQQEPFRALFGRLLMTPPSRPLPQDAARFLAQHATRATPTPQA